MKRLLLVLIALHATILSLAQGTVKLMPGATIQSRNKAYIVLNNMNLKNDGVIQFGAGQGIVSFTGSVNDSIQGSGLTSFDSLRIALSNAGFFNVKQKYKCNSRYNF